MKKISAILWFIASSLFLSAQTSETLLLEGWRFHRGAADGAEMAVYNDSAWEKVTIPHDWAIAGPFDKEIDKQVVAIVQNGEKEATEKTGRSGSLPWIGEGWYRCEITIPEGYSFAELVFDGAMAEPHVWVDGQDVGGWAYGYTPFRLDITSAVKGCIPGTYSVAVHLQNVEESSRWYPGAGLYRPVRLVLHKEKYFKGWGIFARTTSLDGPTARIHVTSEVVAEQAKDLLVTSRLLDFDGNEVARSQAWMNDSKQVEMTLEVPEAHLWSPETPYLYTLVTELAEGDRIWDVQTQKYGIRTIEYSADGFKLNGAVRKIKGVCLHHDLGPLGAAFNKAAFRRQVALLKDMGCDAIRTSHNVPAPWQMEICDEMGMMVMAESFDMWIYPKCKNGYARFFPEWWQRDITNLVLTTRGHASCIMYSIGNEIPEQSSADGLKYSRLIQNYIHALDPTRPCTQGNDNVPGAMWSGVWQNMDVPGFNYRVYYYQDGYKAAPKGFVLGSETASTISSRGVYKFPVKEAYGEAYEDGQISSYDLESCIWSNLPDDDWMYQDKCPWVIGEFVWTGFDYLGEPTPYDEYWPSRSSYFGIFDLAGLPKDRAYLYRTHWNQSSETLHLLPHWNWTGREGEVTPVFCYTSYPSAELFVNGKSQGRLSHQDMSLEEYESDRIQVPLPWGGFGQFPNPQAEHNRLDRYRLRWMDTVYEPGELKVVAYNEDGSVAAEKTVHTAGKPHHIELVADRCQLDATSVDDEGRATDTPDLAFVTVRVVDAAGNLCPDAANQLSFAVKGAAKFKACCNGDATSLESFVQSTMKVFNGELVVVLEAGKDVGRATLTVTGKGLKNAKLPLEVK